MMNGFDDDDLRKSSQSLYKVLIVGETNVGKTCLLRRYSEGTSSEMQTKATLGLDFRVKTIEVDGRTMKLQLWDTSGQERFRSMTRSYYRGAVGILLTYDVTQEKTFRTLNDWLKDIERNAPEDVELIIVGNKCDSDARVIATETGSQFAIQRNLTFFETSAKTNINVNNAFETLAQAMAANSRPRAGTMQESSNRLNRALSSTAHLSSSEKQQKSRCSPC
ncbi:ras-related protein Rab-13-like [Antedon mediterranea]|uniref:ras-related protein Rab-13-like n=1 Tax=Antedon mediterranea TaxID=105859 RepID=UPI003AF6363E